MTIDEARDALYYAADDLARLAADSGDVDGAWALRGLIAAYTLEGAELDLEDPKGDDSATRAWRAGLARGRKLIEDF